MWGTTSNNAYQRILQYIAGNNINSSKVAYGARPVGGNVGGTLNVLYDNMMATAVHVSTAADLAAFKGSNPYYTIQDGAFIYFDDATAIDVGYGPAAGLFQIRTGDQSAAVTASNNTGMVRAINGDATGASGAAFRVNPHPGAYRAGWWDIKPDGTDYSAKMQTAVDYISAQNGGTLYLAVTGATSATRYVMQWQAKSGVVVASESFQFAGTDPGTAIPGTAVQVPAGGGFVISQAAGVPVYGGGALGLYFVGLGPPGVTAGTPNGGIQLGTGADNCWDFLGMNCYFFNFADQAVQCGSKWRGFMLHMDSENCLLNRTRTQADYVMDFNNVHDGTVLYDIVGTPSLTALTDANRYVRAVRIGGNNVRADRILAQFGDVGMVLEGSLQKIGEIRAEFSFAQNFIGACTGSTIDAIHSNNGSKSGAGAYNGIEWQASATNNVIQLEQDVSDGSNPGTSYGLNDQVSDANNKNVHLCVVGYGQINGLFSLSATDPSVIQTVDNPARALPANAATAALEGKRLDTNFYTANTAATTYTGFTGVVPGATYTIRCADANSTLQQNSQLQLGGANIAMVQGTTYTFKGGVSNVLHLMAKG